jgi:hypothetical protein
VVLDFSEGLLITEFRIAGERFSFLRHFFGVCVMNGQTDFDQFKSELLEDGLSLGEEVDNFDDKFGNVACQVVSFHEAFRDDVVNNEGRFNVDVF